MRHARHVAAVILSALVGTAAYAADVSRLASPDVATGDEFGRAVAADRGTVVVGAPFHDQDATDAGTAYVFTARGIFLPLQTELRPSDPEESAHFGAAVAVSGDTAVVGAPDDGGAGAAYVFERTSGTWAQVAKLTSGTSGDRLGASVAIDGDTIVAGAPGRSASAGAVFVFVRSGASWTQQSEIAGASGALGMSVDVNGDRLVAGAPLASSSQGLASVYLRTGAAWTLEASLVPVDAADGDETGGAVAIDGTWIAVGAAKADATGATDAGAVHVYGESGGAWTRWARLLAPTPAASAAFGAAVALDGDALAVGSPLRDLGFTDAGGVDRFAVGASGWEFRASVTVPGVAASDELGAALAIAAGRVVSATPGRDGGVAFAQWGDADERLTASDGAAGDAFGVAIDVSGDTALVGASGDDDRGSGAGGAYVFERAGGAWTELQKLTASDGAADDSFGWSVSLSGDTALVGAYGDDDRAAGAGAAYVFVRSGGVWTQQQKLTAPDGEAGDMFGRHVDLSGDTALVGMQSDDDLGTNAGSAYVFVRSGTTWTSQQKLTASDGAAADAFGRAVALSGDTALVGALLNDGGGTDAGAAYVFVRAGGNWTQQWRLTASDPVANGWFGGFVALDGDTALVAAHGDDDKGLGAGAAYVYVRTGTSWALQQKLTASDGYTYQFFGWDVALAGDVALVGAYGAPGTAAGEVYVFRRSSGTWGEQFSFSASNGAAGDAFGRAAALDGDTALVGASSVGAGSVWVRRIDAGLFGQTAKLAASDAAADDLFGYCVSVSGDTALIGACLDDDLGAESGSAYVFVRSGGTWTQQQKLTAADGAAYDHFGSTVALSGDTALVGANGDDDAGTDSGAAYVFVRSGGAWTQQAKLTAADAATGDEYGSPVAIDGDTVIVGALAKDQNRGAAYVHVRSNGVWSQQVRLTASDGLAGDVFGNAVALHDDTAIVAAKYADGLRGHAYVFVRSGATWTQTQVFTADDVAPDTRFGYVIAFDGVTAVVTAPKPNAYRGVAHVFARVDGVWTQQARLEAIDGAAGDWFGASAAVEGELMVVGATGRDGLGASYVYSRSNGAWGQRMVLTDDDPASEGQFGGSVSLSGGRLLVAGPRGSDDSGAVCAFEQRGLQPTTSIDSLPPEWTVGVPLTRPCSVSGGTEPYQWRITAGELPPGLTLDASSGAVFGAPASPGHFSYTVEACDAWGATSSTIDAITINAAPEIPASTLPTWTITRPYSAAIAQTGGTSPLTWDVASAAAPPGITLTATGELTGTPTATGTFVFAARVTDAVGATATGTMSVTIQAWPSLGSLPIGAQGRPYDASPGVASGTSPFLWAIAAGDVPDGLALDPATGRLVGTPMAAGATTLDFQVTDAAGATATRNCPLVVVPRCGLAKAKLTERHDIAAGQGGADIVRFVELLGGTNVDVTMTLRTKTAAAVELLLLDTAQQPIDLAPYTRRKKKVLTVRDFVVPATGRYFVVVRPAAGFEGRITLTVAASADRKWRGGGTLDPAGQPLEFEFCALPGSKLVVATKASRRSAAVPTVGGLADAVGGNLLVPGELKESRRGATLRAKTRLVGGNYLLTIAPRGGAVGDVEWTVRLRSPRGYVFDLPELAVGGGGE